MLRVGVAESNITPRLGISIPGHFNDRKATDVHDDLFASAMVLEQGEVRVAVVSCDLICLPRDVVQAARDIAATRSGVSPQHMMVCCTHTHTGAATADGLLGVDRDWEYTEWLAVRIADVVQLAVNRLQPARVGWGLGQEKRLTFNRRFLMKDGTVVMNPGRQNPDIVRPAGPIDPDVGVFYVEGESGPLGLIINFALHYVGTDSATALSADYFGHFRRLLKRIQGPSFVTVFLNGACGDINNVDVNDPQQGHGHAQAARVAGVLAGDALSVLKHLRLRPECALGGASRVLRFRRKTITPEDIALSRAILAGEPVQGTFSWVRGRPPQAALLPTYARQCLALHAMPEWLETEVQALRLEDAGLVGLPGEIFVEIGLDIKARSPFPMTMVAELANDYIGYVPTEKAHREGGYETWASRSALPDIGTGEAMADLAVELLESLR